MESGIIRKADLGRIIDAAAQKNTVFYAPADGENGVELKAVSNHEEIAFGYDNLRLSPKSVLFPQNEVICRYTGDTVEEEQIGAEDAIIFGIRPCDVFALSCLDKVFGGENARFQDPYYMRRREKALIVALVCDDPRTTCFCTSVGGGPFSTDGLDLLWTDLGDRYLVEAITEQGAALIANSPHMREAGSEDIAQKAEIAALAEQAVSGPDVQGVKEKLDRMYDSPFWQTAQLKCLGCGACTYLCPTCHCFDIADEGDRRQGQRVRNWDTCMFRAYSLEASGHNPRPTNKERTRQRIMHKYAYFTELYDEIGCTGCGRCVRYCPVNLDIRQMIRSVQSWEEE